MGNSPFSILGSDKVPTEKGSEVTEANKDGDLNERIKGLIGSSKIFLFMKGNPQAPQCGFSANVVAILNAMNAEFKTFDILSDMDIRQGVKEFANWPTFPQLYVNNKLIGGNDIVHEMYEDGELEAVLNS